MLGVCALIHESNAFAGEPTELRDFVRLDGEAVGVMGRGSGTEVGGALEAADALGVEVVATSAAFAQSGGLVRDDAATALIDELVQGVARAHARAALRALVVCLHGSMCADSDPDVEGTVLTRLRALLGRDVPIVATLDWHCSITEAMVAAADALVAYRTYPHVDQAARGADAARLALALAGSRERWHPAWVHLLLLVAGPQTRDAAAPMQAVLRRAQALAVDDGRILSWSVCPGFARSDTPRSGAHVYALATEPQAASAFVREVSSALWAHRSEFDPQTTSPAAAVARALASARTADRPVVLSDQGDNPGGGAPGSSTTLLDELVAQGAAGSLVASLHAPAAVRACHDAGVEAAVDLALGDETRRPATVAAVAEGRYVMHSPTHPNLPMDVGPVARARLDSGVEVLLTTTRVQNLDLQLLETVGVDVRRVPIVAVKSNAHFRAAFEPVASEVIDVDTPGLSTPHLKRLPYRRIRRPCYPLDRDLEWSAERSA